MVGNQDERDGVSDGVLRVAYTRPHPRATAGTPRDEPVEELVEAGTQNDEQYEEPVEQARTQA